MAIEIPEGNPDKKFKYVERILRRMSRRIHKTVAVAVPPIPVTHYAVRPDGDVLFRYFFIVDCELSNFMLAISSLGEAKTAEIRVEMSGNDYVSNKTFTIKAGQNVLEMSELISVKSSTVMKICLIEPVEIGEYWLGFMCGIDPGENKVIKTAIDALEEGAKGIDE